jgi:hypothetical protein
MEEIEIKLVQTSEIIFQDIEETNRDRRPHGMTNQIFIESWRESSRPF